MPREAEPVLWEMGLTGRGAGFCAGFSIPGCRNFPGWAGFEGDEASEGCFMPLACRAGQLTHHTHGHTHRISTKKMF